MIRSNHSSRVAVLLASLVAVVVTADRTPAQSPPTPDFTWNNFVGGTTNWSTAANWLPANAPTGSIDRVLGFGSSPLQSAAGYTSTFDSTFDLNSLVFSGQGSSGTAINLLGAAAGNTLQFNTSSTGALPSIWQTGTGRVTIQNGQATNGITLNNGTTLQILGAGIGELQLTANIVQAGTGNGGLLINQTGIRPLASGGIVRLGGANTFAGGVNLTAGNLLIANNAALGTGTFTVNGGTLQFDPTTTTGFTLGNAVTLNSTLTITGNNALSATAPAFTGTFSGPIGGAGGLTIANNNANLSSGNFATVNYALTAANTFTGPLSIAPSGNTATLLSVGTSTVTTGSIAGVTAITVSWSGTLRLDNTAGVATRLNTTTAPALTLSGSTVQLFGNALANSAETFGTLTLGGGGVVTVFGASAAAQTTSLTFAGLSRPTNGTLILNGTNLGSGSGAGESILRFTADPGNRTGGTDAAGSPAVRILPYAYANAAASTSTTAAVVAAGFTRWDAGTQRIVPLNPATEYAADLFTTGTTAPTSNHRYASTTTLPSAFGVAGLNYPTSINSLVLDTNTAATNRAGVSVSGTATLTVTGGAIFSTINGSTGTAPSNNNAINTGGLDFGAVPGYVHTQANLTVNAPVLGSGGLVKGGAGALVLNGANAFTGGLTVNAGQVQFTSDANLGAAGQPITLQGGSAGGLQFLAPALWVGATTSSTTVNRPITLGAGGGIVNIPALNHNLTLAGNLTGSGQLFKTGSGVLNLSGDNSGWTGTLTPINGVVTVQNDAALGGTGATLNLIQGILQPLSSFSTAKDMLVVSSAFIYTGGQNLTLTGNLTSQNAAPTMFKTGLGDLTITSTSTLLGGYQNGLSNPTSVVFATTGNGVQTSGRTVLSGANGAMPVAASMFVNANGEIVLDNSAAVNNNRLGTVTVSLVGGNMSLLGNASASVNEAIGLLSFSNANNPYGGILTVSTPAGSGQSTTLSALSLSANAAGGTVFVRGTNLGAATGDRTAVVFGTTPTQVNGLVPSLVGATSATAEPTDFLTLATVTQPAPNANQFALTPFTAYTPGTGTLGAGSAANTYDVTAAASFAGTSAANALRMKGAALDLGGGTLTLGAAHVLSTGGAPASINNGTLAFGANVGRFTVTTGSDLTVSATTTGTAGLIKTGNGTLILSAQSTISVTAGTTFFGVGQGTLRYGVANALPANASNVFINAGATLDINGTTSTVGNINGYGNVALGSGTLTVGSLAQVLFFGGALSGTGTLVKNTAGITTSLAGDSTAGFTGGVQVLGGTLAVVTPGAIGTGTSPILLGDTTGTARATLSLGTLLQTFTRDITVQAGSTPGAATPHTILVGTTVLNLSGNIALGQNIFLDNAAGANTGNVTLSGTISGTGGITTNNGNWSFTGNNTFSGGVTLNALQTTAVGVGSDTAFGVGTLTFDNFGGNLRADGGARTLANPVVVTSVPGYMGMSGFNNITLTGTVNLSAAAVVTPIVTLGTGVTTLAGVVSNSTLGINKNGPGILALAGANTYAGTTTVNAGTLLANNTTGSATGLSNVVVNGGAILGGNGTVGDAGARTVAVNAGGVVRPGSGSTNIATLTVNSTANVSFAPGSTLQVNVGTSTSVGGKLAITGGGTADFSALTAAAPMNLYLTDVAALSFNTPYSMTVVDGGSTPFVFPGGGFNSNLFKVTTTFANSGITVLNPGNAIVLNFTPVPEPMTVLGLAAAGAGFVGLTRRVRRRLTA